MAFDTETRNKLARMVADTRTLLRDEFTRQLQEIYGIQPDGKITEMEKLTHLDDEQRDVANLLRERVEHLAIGMGKEKNPIISAIDRMTREQSFTVLNRFAALRMCEERGLIQQCVGNGMESEGFEVFLQIASSSIGDRYDRYCCFIFCVFDEIAVDLGILFDRFSPFGLLFPRESALNKLIGIVTQKGLKHIWVEDEAIGWIYQYFNSAEERKAMRKASSAPRNSRELAVRNQFFTPRYVVEFLADNTLGRIWYDMRKGKTTLKDDCKYIVRRPNEIFLGDIQQAYDHIWGAPEDGEYFPGESVNAAYKGDLSKISEDDGPDSRWISVAIPPSEIAKISGEPYAPFEDDRIGKLIHDMLEDQPNSDAGHVSLVWAALSEFTLTDGGGAYSINPWRKLWSKFCDLVKTKQKAEDLSQEELLKTPVFLENRKIKDPRDFRVLDPACGSGHFLLYAFDLLKRIYEEAWEDSESPKSEATGRTLRKDFENLDDLRLAVPKLIIQYNLHGIDIDPRAVQIAALALWLRAQKAWETYGIQAVDRPKIKKANIVTAEPMPGDKEMLREFNAGLKPRVLGQLVDVVFDKMKFAGEAGSLLKIEEEITDVIADAKRQWMENPKPEQQDLFPSMVPGRPKQQELRFNFEGVTDERFWEEAEEHILDALKDYAERAENGHAIRRQLFAEDAAHGFAFIDLCRKRYDIVLMNPPFGEGIPSISSYLSEFYPLSKHDIAIAIVERWFSKTMPGGRLGAITTRTPLYNSSSTLWRQQVFFVNKSLVSCLDLGPDVLDAMVETAAYVLCKSYAQQIPTFIRLNAVPAEEKASVAWSELEAISNGSERTFTVFRDLEILSNLPNSPLAYWLPVSLTHCFEIAAPLRESGAEAWVGLQTSNDERFLRLWWESPPENDYWIPFVKGGSASPYFADVHLVVNWEDDGKEMKAYHDYLNYIGKSTPGNGPRREFPFYFRPGLTWVYRTERFHVQPLPTGCITSTRGPGIYSDRRLQFLLGYLNSSIADVLIKVLLGRHKHPQFDIDDVNAIPTPDTNEDLMSELGLNAWRIRAQIMCAFEVHRGVDFKLLYRNQVESGLAFQHSNTQQRRNRAISELSRIQTKIDKRAAELAGVSFDAIESIKDMLSNWENFGIPDEDKCGFVHRTLSYLIGFAFGRWDIRIVLDTSLLPKMPGPFDALPACPPAMLLGPEGLPADANRIVSEEWLRGRPAVNTLPPEGSINNSTILDSEYPLRIPWNGILVDDPGFNDEHPHRDDIVRRVREVLDLIWGEKGHEIEQEAIDILGLSDLRDFFRKPSGLLQDHLKRYSKSRRKAPIYWPLSTESGSYTLWIYYNRLTDQTLFACIADYIKPKIDETTRDIERLQKDLADTGTAKIRTELEKLQDFRQELIDMKEEILRVAKLPYKPNLNDGVMITASPLWRLFRYKPWQKGLKACWEKLKSGKYDWAHLAYSIWPDRVKDSCRNDRSIAIAHDLEHICEVAVNKTMKKRVRKKIAG